VGVLRGSCATRLESPVCYVRGASGCGRLRDERLRGRVGELLVK
jgi:hypothetical protein